MINSLSLKQLFLGVFLISVFIIGCKVDKIDDLSPIQQNVAEEEVCLLQISGKVLNTKNFKPLPNVQVKSTLFEVETDLNGEFEIELKQSEMEGLDQIQVSKDGYLMNQFFADHAAVINASNCSEVTSIDWELGISPKQTPQWVGVEGASTFHIMDTIAFAQPKAMGELEILKDIRAYTVEIKKGTLEKWTNLSISPNNGTAYGTGIVLSEDLHSLARLVIKEEGGISPDGLETTYPNDFVKFQQPIEISFGSPSELMEEKNSVLTTLDVDNITTNELGRTTLADNKVELKLRSTGNLYIGFNEVTTDLVANALDAAKNGYETEESIDALNNVNSNARRHSISISSSVYCDGAIVKQQTFSNCNCGRARWRRYNVSTRNFANATIQFPSNTPNYIRRYVYRVLYSSFGSGNGSLNARYWVYLPMCTVKQVTSVERIRKVTGTIFGYSFSYEGLSSLSTTAQVLDCPTTSACHQGCSN